MSQLKIRSIKITAWVVGGFLSACIGVAAASFPDAQVTIVGISGTTSLTVGVEWVFGAAFALVAGALKYANDRISKLEDIVVGPDGHGERLAHGDEQLKLLKKVSEQVEGIANNCIAHQVAERRKSQKDSQS